MVLKITLFFILSQLAFKSNAQVFLNSDSLTVKKKLSSDSGSIAAHYKTNFEHLESYSSPYFVEVYKFSQTSIKENGIHAMVFYYTLTDKCFMYYAIYLESFKNELIKKLNASSGLAEIKYHEEWQNTKDKYHVYFLKETSNSGPIHSFALKVESDVHDSVR